MPDKLDFPVPYEGTTAQWFIDPNYRRVFTGHHYAHRCVAAIGPADFARVAFVVTSNPRQKAWAMGKAADSSLIVHECAWSVARTAEHVHAEVVALLARANRPDVDGFVTFPNTHLRPLLRLASEKAGIPVMWHADFHTKVLGTETLKLRARLEKAGVEPATVAAHHYV